MQALEHVSHPTGWRPVSTSSNGGKLDARDAQQLVRSTVLAAFGQTDGSHGLQGLVAAISTALSNPDSASADPTADVLKKIEDALRQAGKKLIDQGLDQDTVDATLARFRSDLAKALDSAAASLATPAPAPAAQPSTSVDTLVASAVVKQRGALDILTKEGDRVSIRFRTKDALTTSAFQSTGADGTTTTAVGTTLISRGRLQVEVRGNLNDKELAAIGDLLTHIDDLATKFFSGDVQAAFAAASQLGVDSDQIAGFRLKLTYSQVVRAATSSTRASATTLIPATQAPTTPAAATTPEPAAPAPATPVAAPTTTAATDAPSNPAVPVDTAHTPDSSSTPAASTSADTSSPDSARQTIASFIQDVLSKLGSVEGAGRLQFSLSWKVELLVTALSIIPRPAPGPADTLSSDTTKLLGDALQKATA